MTLEWVDGFVIKTELNDQTIIIKANKAGLLSLADHFRKLAQDDIFVGYHLHLNDSNSLEADSMN